MLISCCVDNITKKSITKSIKQDTDIWVLSPSISVYSIEPHDKLFFHSDIQKQYDLLTSENKLDNREFKKFLRQHIVNILSDFDKEIEIYKLVHAILDGKSIMLVGSSKDESFCVRSLLIGILQGADILDDYITDGKKGDYSEYYGLLPERQQGIIERIRDIKNGTWDHKFDLSRRL